MRLRCCEQNPEEEFGQLAEKPLDLPIPWNGAISPEDFG
jgi:hypothetical protein